MKNRPLPKFFIDGYEILQNVTQLREWLYSAPKVYVLTSFFCDAHYVEADKKSVSDTLDLYRPTDVLNMTVRRLSDNHIFIAG